MEPYATADQVWAGGLIFARIGAMLLMLPGIGESYVPPRIRLSLALLISLVPVAGRSAGALPALPDTSAAWPAGSSARSITGLMIGALLRMFTAALSTAGEIVSLQTTLSFAQTANPLQAQPEHDHRRLSDAVRARSLIFATNTHHLFIAGLVGSYRADRPGPAADHGRFHRHWPSAPWATASCWGSSWRRR